MSAPIAWLIRKTAKGHASIECGKVFMKEDTAQAAAKRLTNRWRNCEAVPVQEVGTEPPGWRCFHCGDYFTDERAARLHFGADETATPACKIKASEGGLIEALRNAEESAWEANQRVLTENIDGLNQWRGSIRRNEVATRAAEESGYEKGLADGRAFNEELLKAAMDVATQAAHVYVAWKTPHGSMTRSIADLGSAIAKYSRIMPVPIDYVDEPDFDYRHQPKTGDAS